MSTKTLITSRDSKGLHIVGLFEAVLNKAGLEDESAQRLIEQGGEFQADLKVAIEKYSATNQFADEEVKSNYGYLSGYKPKSIAEQIKCLKKLFPELGSANEQIANGTLPPNAEGVFAIPRWQKVAPTYAEAVQKVLDIIKKTRGSLYNYRDGQIDSRHLRQSAKTARMLQTISDQQKDCDILAVPCQFGLRHRGRSVRRAREVMNASEIGLDAFSIGIMLLTHPERLQHLNDLWIDCAGDEFSGGGGDRFDRAPCFSFDDDEVEFDALHVSCAVGSDGSASFFAPQ